MPQNDREKEDSSREFEDIRELEAAFKLNVGNNIDKMLAIVTGNYKCPSLPGEPDKITRSIRDNDAFRTANRLRRERPRDYEDDDDDNSRGRSVVRNHNGNQDRGGYREADYSGYTSGGGGGGMSKYASVFAELDRFRFADDEERRTRQVTHIANTVRAALQELTLRDVAYNTRQAFKDYVTNVQKIPGGIEVSFDFKGTKVKVAARGAFSGEETVVVYRKGDKVYGGVVRQDNGEEVDLTANYGITLGK